MKFTFVVPIAATLMLGGGALLWKATGQSGLQSKEPEVVSSDWTPPNTSIDADYVIAAKALLGNGLADPRKGRFCHVRVSIGDAAWSPEAVKEGYGWVDPDGKHAVLFDGVEYPIQSIPAPADLESIVKRGAGGAGIHTPSPIDVGTSSVVLPALLLLVGRTDLAEALFKSRPRGYSNSGAGYLFTHLAQRYNMLAAQALISRKDAEGVEWSRELFLVDTVREKANLPAVRDVTVDRDESVEYANKLFHDFRRRVDHPKAEPIDLVALRKQDQAHQIATLVEDLDTVEGKQMSQPGGAEFYEEPVYGALVKEGQAAVPALIDAFQNDDRFSRTVSYGRNFFPMRSIHTVKDVAWRLMCGNLAERHPLAIRTAQNR